MKLSELLAASSLVFAMGIFQSSLASAHDEKMTSSDVALVSQIREDLAKDTNLSGPAQNIKIHAFSGKVILKGTVTSEGEKQTIYDKVAAESGVSSVVNKLDVKSE